MAVMNRTSASTRQERAAEQAASFTAEQRRLKAAAADRRAAAVADEGTGEGFSARSKRPPTTARRSKYLT
jgi:hypothetical protein